MKRYLILLGTRPEAIKLCPLILALRQRKEAEIRVVLSGQHREMPYPVLHFFGVRADADLGVMQPGQTVQALTERLLAAISDELKHSGFRPDACFVHGDTTTAFVGALCCFYAGIPVYHVEAGLRTHDIHAPFPEEFNRRAIDAMSEVFFAPTQRAARQLLAEGIVPSRVFTVGNTATDALRLCLQPGFCHPLLQRAAGRRLLLLTLHRRELPEAQRLALLWAIRQEIEWRDDVFLIFAVHPSPTVRAAAREAFSGCVNACLTEPLELPVLQNLLVRATMLLTDSGGLQEEATYLGIPTLVLRERTERPEGVEVGVLRMVGTDPVGVRRQLAVLLDDADGLRQMQHASSVYGDGYASEAIVQALDFPGGAVSEATRE